MLRFKRDDGTNYPEWKEKKLDEFFRQPIEDQRVKKYGNKFLIVLDKAD